MYDYDKIDDFDNPEVIEFFLNNALESRDTGAIGSALGMVARARGMTSIANDTGLCREQLYRCLSKTGNPTLKTLVKILTTFGLELQIRRIT